MSEVLSLVIIVTTLLATNLARILLQSNRIRKHRKTLLRCRTRSYSHKCLSQARNQAMVKVLELLLKYLRRPAVTNSKTLVTMGQLAYNLKSLQVAVIISNTRLKTITKQHLSKILNSCLKHNKIKWWLNLSTSTLSKIQTLCTTKTRQWWCSLSRIRWWIFSIRKGPKAKYTMMKKLWWTPNSRCSIQLSKCLWANSIMA